MFDGTALTREAMQLWVKSWIDQVPAWFAFVNDGSHGVLGILIGVTIAVWALALVFNATLAEQ